MVANAARRAGIPRWVVAALLPHALWGSPLTGDAGGLRGSPPSVVRSGEAPADDSVPLFASDEPLVFTLVADFDALRRDRHDDPEDRPAQLILASGDTLDVELRPRGNFRRDPAVCSFPPLRLDVKKNHVQGTPFQGQDKLKMVVPCRGDRDDYEQYVLREYLLYRVYALVTDLSFRVRLARVTFADAPGDDDSFTRFSFLIESDEGLAARVGGRALDIPEGKIIRAQALDPTASTRVAVFQYMIGNTDWADAQVHNSATFAVAGKVVPVPYDFDFSGAVATPYATPAPQAPIANVLQRFYMGWCWPGLDGGPILEAFREIQPQVDALYRSFPYLDEDVRDTAQEYLDSFFQTAANPDRAQRRMFRDCRKLPG